jgi:hypothetical protein
LTSDRPDIVCIGRRLRGYSFATLPTESGVGGGQSFAKFSKRGNCSIDEAAHITNEKLILTGFINLVKLDGLLSLLSLYFSSPSYLFICYGIRTVAIHRPGVLL